jgi:hypothetical protein
VARFYSNENIALPVVIELRQLGHNVLTSLDAGKANFALPDAEVLAFAAAEGRILLSYNRRHFVRLHRDRTASHAGIVVCTFDPDFAALAHRIHISIASVPEMTDQLIRVNRAS